MSEKLQNEHQSANARSETGSAAASAGVSPDGDISPGEASAAYYKDGSSDGELSGAEQVQREILEGKNERDIDYIVDDDDDVDLSRYDDDDDEVDTSRYEIDTDDIDHIAHKRVLLVEDDRDIVGIITEHLEEMKVKAVDVVNNADAAYFLITKDKELFPDIVLLELALPGTDGIQLLARLRAHKSARVNTLPAVVITMLDSPSIYRRAARQKVGAFLRKPISKDGLRIGMTAAFNGEIVEQPYSAPRSWLDDIEEEELRQKQEDVKARAAAKASKQGFLVRLLSALIPWSGKA